MIIKQKNTLYRRRMSILQKDCPGGKRPESPTYLLTCRQPFPENWVI
jgi:hypothetical protein